MDFLLRTLDAVLSTVSFTLAQTIQFEVDFYGCLRLMILSSVFYGLRNRFPSREGTFIKTLRC